MKKIFLLGVLTSMWIAVISQVPQTFNYQGIVRDNSGNIVADQNISVKISIAPEGTYVIPVYSETHNVTTNQFGLFTLKVGEGNPIEGEFDKIRWWEGSYLLQTAVDITGGSNFQEMGATQIVSVPFSLYSKGLILTDANGQSYVVTVDEQGNLSTNQLYTKCGDTFTDPRDGHNYGTAQIGNQCWMISNLGYGTIINSSTAQTDNGVVEVYCYSDNPYACQLGGGLYTWDEMMNYSTDSINQGICPDGWRIPTDNEWKILEGMADDQYDIGDPVWSQTGWRGTNAGGNLKSTNSNFWNSPNTGATDRFGMGIAGSGLFDGNAFSGAAENAYFYSSVETGTSALIRKLSYDNASIFRGDIPKTYAASVRCISVRSYPNNPPEQPSNPSPANGSIEQSNVSVLSWQCSDPENESLTYDVFFGTSNPPSQVSPGQGINTYDPGQLQPGNTYYWKITAHDYMNTTEGVVWSFTTTTNLPPAAPSNPAPPDQSQDLDPYNTILSWSCSDPNNDPLTYDVYLELNGEPVINVNGISDTSFNPSPLEFGAVYDWKVVANDGLNQTESQVWSFTTLMNMAPDPPYNPEPADGGALPFGYDTLRWSCIDPDNDNLTYDVLFGDDQYNLNVIAYGIQDTVVNVSSLVTPGNYYYWRVIARDQYFETSGSTWSFMADFPPVGKPYNPGPANNATDVSILTNLTWEDTVYQDCYTYQIYFGTETPPPLMNSVGGCSQVLYELPQQLQPNMMYYWRIDAVDYYSNTTVGDLWRFTTTGNTPPNQPSDPQPGNNVSDVAIDDTLFWSCSDPQNDALTYDVYFGTDANSLPIVSSGQSDTNYVPGTMLNGTYYYWKVVAKDNLYETEGDVWSFLSGNNTPPNAPANPTPSDNSADISIFYPELSWNCTDDDGNPLTYDLYFGTTNPPPFLQYNLNEQTYILGELTVGTQYYWKIVANDNYTGTSSAVWTFTTSSDNPPNMPIDPQPLSNSLDQPVNTVLSWSCSDPDNDQLTYDVYFGQEGNMLLVSSGQSGTTYDPGQLQYSMQYQWKIVASDSFYETEGNVWFFTTIDDLPPDPPSNPQPSDNSSNQPLNTTLSWQCSDPDNSPAPLTYDVYFGTNAGNLPLVSTGQSGTTYDPGQLQYGMTYFWKIVASDSYYFTEGDIWVFYTVYNEPPDPPSNPTPSNNATGISTTQTLSWTCNDPEGDIIYYNVYFGTDQNNLQLVSSGQSETTFDPGTMSASTQYFWYIESYDQFHTGEPFPGEIWNFTTGN